MLRIKVITISLIGLIGIFGFNKSQQFLPTPTPPSFPGFRVTNPKPGDLLQGIVDITTNNKISSFAKIEIEFAYTNTQLDNWFTIELKDSTSDEFAWAYWDTTTITDGLYTIRIKLTSIDNKEYIELLPNLRVRNYSHIETAIPATQNLKAITPSEFSPITPERQAASTTIPQNPMQISSNEIFNNILIGATCTILLFLLGFIYTKLIH